MQPIQGHHRHQTNFGTVKNQFAKDNAVSLIVAFMN